MQKSERVRFIRSGLSREEASSRTFERKVTFYNDIGCKIYLLDIVPGCPCARPLRIIIRRNVDENWTALLTANR